MENQTRVAVITKAGRVASLGTKKGSNCGVSQDLLSTLSAIIIIGRRRFFPMDTIIALKE
jgi:hypothetical protein